MPGRQDPKDTKPGYRVQPGATNGPHAWGNGPKPYGILKRIFKALQGK